MVYTRRTWANAPATTTPITASSLNNIEDGVEEATDAIRGRLSEENLETAIGSVVAADAADPDGVIPTAIDEVGRTIFPTKGELLVNVKSYGAKGDGVTDDTAAIQAAIAVIENATQPSRTAQGKVLFFPDGTYKTTGITATKGFTFRGAHMDRSYISLINGSNNHVITVTSNPAYSYFEGLSIDGNKSNQDAGILRHAINLADSGGSDYHAGAWIQDCRVGWATGYGLFIGASRANGRVYRSRMGGGTLCNATDWAFEQNEFQGSVPVNLQITASGCAVMNNYIYKATQFNVLLTTTCKYSWIIGNTMDSSDQVGLKISSLGSGDQLGHIVSGNQFYNNSKSATGTYSHILLEQTNGVTIIGNSFFKYTGASDTAGKYLVECVTAPSNIIFEGNVWNTAAYVTGITNDTSRFARYSGKGVFIDTATSPRFTDTLTAKGFNGNPASTSGDSYTIFVSGEGNPRWRMYNSGQMNWGPGSGAVDVNLYRSAADKLKTDDMIIAALGLGVGNSAAATTLGAVTRKIEVFDASGTSLGFVPVYGSIT